MRLFISAFQLGLHVELLYRELIVSGANKGKKQLLDNGLSYLIVSPLAYCHHQRVYVYCGVIPCPLRLSQAER